MARPLLAAAIVTAFAVLLRLPSYGYAGAAMDEGLQLVFPERLLRGAVPHHDFQLFYGPASYWLLAGTYALFGVNQVAERTVGLIYQASVVVALFALAYRWGPLLGLGSGLIVASLTVPLGLAASSWMAALALALSSVWSLARGGRDLAPALIAGAAAGLAVSFRVDTAPVVVAAALPLLVPKGPFRAYALGFLVGAIPLAMDVLRAGPVAVVDDVFLEALRWAPGRRLPLIGGAETPLLGLAGIAGLGLLLVGVVSVRRSPQDRAARILLSLGLLASGFLYQALLRADLFHILWGGGTALGLLPVTLYAVLPRARLPAARAASVAVLLAVGLIAAASPHVILRVALTEAPRALGLQPSENIVVERGGRPWHPLAQSHDLTYTPIGSEEAASELRSLLSDVERVASPGDRLFVGPLDLRRTNLTDTFLYYLLPELEPATYYLVMNPGINRPGSRLASDIASADILILTSRYEDWNEPNDSMLFGPDGPNNVVRAQFTLRSRHGHYSVFVRARP